LLRIDKRINRKELDVLYRKELIKPEGSFLLFPEKKNYHNEYNSDNNKYIILGDLVSDNSTDEIKKSIAADMMSDFGGFFYIICLSYSDNSMKIFSSVFNILPVYYYEDNTKLIVSSKLEYVVKLTGKFGYNKKYILERVLFNYPLFNETIYKSINLLPSNHFIEITDKLRIRKHFEITDHFNDEPRAGKKVLEEISENFISIASSYFPDEVSAVSFTSGFDGRSLIALGKKLNKKFLAYSFGSMDSIDLTLPREQAGNLGIEFIPYVLNEEYIKSHSLNCGLDLIDKSEGNASFARAHYRYAAELLSERATYLITGNFGSELFRAFHNPGVVVSEELFLFFRTENDNWIDEIKTSKKLKYLNSEIFKSEIKELIEELNEYKVANKELPKNSLFYKYIFEEVFRKYFGPEIVMQSHYIMNRSPYLDSGFIKFLLTTKYAGVYSEFATDNPVKRFKGQLPYSYIIKNTFPPMMKMMTGKGYKPSDLLGFTGKMKLVMSKLRKKSGNEGDPFSVNASFNHNKGYFASVKINEELFNSKLIAKALGSNGINDLNNIIQLLSLNYYLKKILV